MVKESICNTSWFVPVIATVNKYFLGAPTAVLKTDTTVIKEN